MAAACSALSTHTIAVWVEGGVWAQEHLCRCMPIVRVLSLVAGDGGSHVHTGLGGDGDGGILRAAEEVGSGGGRTLAYLPHSSSAFAYYNSLPNFNGIKLSFRTMNFENQKFSPTSGKPSRLNNYCY